MQFRSLSKAYFFVFVSNFFIFIANLLILMQLGAKLVESPFIEFCPIPTVLYFLYFSVVMHGVTLVENTFVSLSVNGFTDNSVYDFSGPQHKPLINGLKSSILPPGGYGFPDINTAIKYVKDQIHVTKLLISKLVKHKLQLDNLSSIAIKGYNEQLSSENIN